MTPNTVAAENERRLCGLWTGVQALVEAKASSKTGGLLLFFFPETKAPVSNERRWHSGEPSAGTGRLVGLENHSSNGVSVWVLPKSSNGRVRGVAGVLGRNAVSEGGNCPVGCAVLKQVHTEVICPF